MDIAVSHETAEVDPVLQAVLQTVQDSVIVFDGEGRIQTLNASAARFFGYGTDELVGSPISNLLPDLDAAFGDGRREGTALHKDGRSLVVELTVNPLPTGSRLFVAAVGDLSERRAAERHQALAQAEAFYRALSEGAMDYAITVLDPDGRIASWNEGARKLKGYEAAEIVGRHFSIFYTPEDIAEGIPELALARARDQGKFEEESLRVRKDGSQFWASQVIGPVWADNGVLLGFVKVTRDITERKEAEAAVHDYVERLTRSNQELDDFAYIASHDLKEPIRGLSNNARFLQEDYAEAIDDGGKKRLNRMVYLCQRMESLVDDLLYFSRLSRQDLAIQPVDLNTVIRDIEVMMEATLLERDAEIVVPEPLPVITCDVPRVTELFRNLITNAVKYNNKPKKQVEIGVSAGDGKKGTPVFYVRDNGIGIEPRFFSDIFRIFKRLNEEEDAVKGTGVGLTFVKKIVERHGGRIWLESAPGAGTTFYFTLQPSEGA
jgi:PAS domain S-box-containing protein